MSEPISASRYWVLRGSFGEGETVAWASVPVLHQGGPIDGRLVADPGEFTIGLPSAVGAPPERTTLEVEIDNTDGALDRYVVGSERTATEYTDANFLTFEAQLFRGTIAADGTCTEEAFTPILAASGPVTVDRAQGTISLALAHIDRPMMGKIGKLYTVREVARGGNPLVVCLFPELVAAMGDGGAAALWDLLGQGDSENADTTVPWLYGPATAPLIRVTPSGRYPAAFIAGMSWDKPQLDGTLDLEPAIVGKLRSEYPESGRTNYDPVPFVVSVELPLEDGGTRWAQIAMAVQARKRTDGSEEPESFWWVSNLGNGLSDIYGPSSPARVLREIITDHSEAGAACLHAASWDAAEAQQAMPMRRACAGRIEADTTIADLVECIAPIGDMGLWVGTDGLLHVRTGGWGLADRDEAAGVLPELIEPDIYPGDADGTAVWSETVPSDPDDRGAVLTHVSVAWTDEQRELYPIPTSLGQAPRRVPLAVDSEWEPEGSWINPREAGPVVRAMASRGAYPTRRVDTVSHASQALLGPGSKLRVSHPWGVTAEPPYQRRLVATERARVQPAEHAALLTLEDLGPSERMRLGLLDSIDKWVLFDPTELGYELGLRVAGGIALSPEGVFTADMVGCTIWVGGAADAENNRSYEIIKFVSAGEVGISPAPASDEDITATSAAPIDAAWIIMRTHRSEGSSWRPDYIRGAALPSGELDHGDTGYQFGGR